MRRVEFVPLLLTDRTDIFTIRIDGAEKSEFQKFLIMFKDNGDPYLRNDMDRILAAIEKISQNGALESYFRNEGKMSDRVGAIPLLIQSRNKALHGTLRLYCIRISDTLLIIGGGGLKKTDSYEEDKVLLSHVQTLQEIDSKIMCMEHDGMNPKDDLVNITIQID